MATPPAKPPRMTIDVSNYPRDNYTTPPSPANSQSSYSQHSSGPAAYSSPRNDAHRQAALRRLLIGSFSFGIGLAVTLITYSLAAPGGIYLVAWGAILYGFIDILRGLAGLL